MIHETRKFLVRLGKALPFVICFLLVLHYGESIIAMFFENYVDYGGYIILNTPLSFFIGGVFEYNPQMLLVLSVLSIALETCVLNRLAILYLALHMLMKDIIKFEVEVWHAYIIIIANLIVSSLLTLKGINIGYRNLRCIAR